MSQRTTDEEILDPVGEPDISEIEMATRPQSLEGMIVTPYSNGFPNSMEFLDALTDRLEKQLSEVRFNDMVIKPQAIRPGSYWGTIEEKVEPISDVVLMAYGHCGSCTTNTIKDVVALETKGIPAVAYVTEEFYPLGVFDAYHLGAQGLAIIPVEHPIAQIDPNEVPERVTDELVEDTIFALTNPPETVRNEFQSRYDLEDFADRPKYDRCTLDILDQ